MAFQLYETRIEIAEESPTSGTAQALILPANDHLWMGAGPARIVKEEGGEEIEQEAVREGPVPLGGVVVTGAGRLHYEHIIHAVVMGQDLHIKGDSLSKAMEGSLKRCEKLRVGEVNMALPLEPGDKPLPPEILAELVEALFRVLEDVSGVKKLHLLVDGEKTREILHNAFLHQLH